MKAGKTSQAMSKPLALEINHLVGDIYELAQTENVKTVKVADEQADQTETGKAKTHTEYTYTERTDTARLAGYEEAVSALIGLKYTTGDEIALTRKGIADASDTEYLAYLSYVEACKQYARDYFGVVGGGV